MPDVLAISCVHRASPFVVQFTEGFGLRWYGLAYLVGFFLGWLLLRWLARTSRCALTPELASDLIFYAIAGVLIGGRLGYVIFYDQRLLIDPPLIGIIQIWKGGMASHGGIIGVIVACILLARKHSLSTMHLLDVLALSCPAGLALGRVANFINGELWGKPLQESLQANPPWWSIKYPKEILQDGFPYLEKLKPLQELTADLGSFPQSLVLAMQEGRDEVIQAVQPYLTAHYPSQLFQAIAEGPILFCVVAFLWLFPLKPGCVSGGFLVTYGILRITTEVFRQPDIGVALLQTPLGGLSRGQVLSLVMVVAGIAMTVICARLKQSKPLGCLLPAKLKN